MEKLICQVCARAVCAKNGVIAHHGYKRPGYGWSQTPSCAGARYVPYEVSCDRLKEMVEVVKDFIIAQEKALANFISNPPVTLSLLINKSAYTKGIELVCQRPVVFDTNGHEYRIASRMPRTYEFAYNEKMREYERALSFAQADLKEMQQRVREWVRCEGEGRTTPAPKTVSVPRVKKPAKPIKSFRCFIENQSQFEEKIIEETSYQKAKEQYEKILKKKDEHLFYRCGAYFGMKAKEIK